MLLIAAQGLISSNTANTCTMSRTETLLERLKNCSRAVTLKLILPTLISARKHGWKLLTEEVSTSPAHTAVLQCVSVPPVIRLTLWKAVNVSWRKPLKTWWLFIKCYVLARRPKPHGINTAPEDILSGALAGTRNRKISDTSLKSWMCNTRS